MKTKLTKILIAIFAVLGLSAALIPAPVYAADDVCSLDTVPASVKAAYGCPNSNQGSEDDFSNTLQGILNGIIGFLGVVAVIVIIIGGVMYMTSTGDPGKTKRAKDTILYASIGLIICVLSFAIVNFVIINIIGGENQASETTLESNTETESEK